MGKIADSMCMAIFAISMLILVIGLAIGIIQEKTKPVAEIRLPGGMEYIAQYEGEGKGRNKDTFTYYREITTDVIYVCFEEYRKAGLTIMLDPETGLPLTYNRYLELTNANTKED